jgi:hypothetical protein
MAAKPLQIHPAALAELKSAVAWYRERSHIAALNFVAELDRAVDLVIASPDRWPSGEHGTRKFVHSRSFTGRKRPSFKFWPSPTDAGDQDIGRAGANGTSHSIQVFQALEKLLNSVQYAT